MPRSSTVTKIQDPGLYMRTKWDWAFLQGCWGHPLVSPTDVDGEVERHGFFLRIETKLPGAKLRRAQTMRDDRLLGINREVGRPLFTILNLWGEASVPERMQHYTCVTSPIVACDEEGVREFCVWWYEVASEWEPHALR